MPRNTGGAHVVAKQTVRNAPTREDRTSSLWFPGEDGEVHGDSPHHVMKDLYHNAPCGYLSLSPDGPICYVNATFSKWICFGPEELLGKRFHDFLNVAGRIFFETLFVPLLRMQDFFNEVAL
jgi:phosphoserine phosphatase RsbU/P